MAKHWPESEIYGDIRTITDTKHDGSTTAKETGQDSSSQPESTTRKELLKPEFERVSPLWTKETRWDLLTGGFPCQPFSAAGKRKGTADDRHLWPEMFRVIQLTQPTWIIGENVPGIINIENGMVFEQVCLDLENEGYQVQPFIIPACAVNAPHRRDRVWIVANKSGERLEGSNRSQLNGRSQVDWSRDWQEVALATCNDSVDDGLPRIVDGVSYSRAKWRKESLKAYGNAIVPQVAIQIMNAIKESYE